MKHNAVRQHTNTRVLQNSKMSLFWRGEGGWEVGGEYMYTSQGELFLLSCLITHAEHKSTLFVCTVCSGLVTENLFPFTPDHA